MNIQRSTFNVQRSTIGAPASGPARCSADLQSAVSQNCILRGVDVRATLEQESAQPIANRRYSRLQICATILALFLAGIAPQVSLAADMITLAAKWRFALDRSDAGISERWFNLELAYSI